MGLLATIQRTLPVAQARRVVDFALQNRGAILGLDLADNEAGFPAQPFASEFKRARAAGLHVTVHAGEADYPGSAEAVKIAIEDVWNDFLLSPMEAARYVDEFKTPAVGWHMDLGNVAAYGYPEQWVKILGKRIVKLHVKEFSRKKMNEEGKGKGFGVKLGEGDINCKAVMHALDDVGYNTWMCAEVPGGGLTELKDIARRMDRILSL